MRQRIILSKFSKGDVPKWLLRQLIPRRKITTSTGKKGKTQRGFVKWSQHCASRSREKPFEVSVFSGSPTVHGLEWESVQVFVSVSVQGRMWDGGRFTMATTNAAMGEETESSRGSRNNGGFEEGRWNVIPGCCSEWARSAFLMSGVVNSKWHQCLRWKWRWSCTCNAPLRHRLTAWRRCGSSTLDAATCLALYSSTLPILSSGSFTLFPISAYTAQSR